MVPPKVTPPTVVKTRAISVTSVIDFRTPVPL